MIEISVCLRFARVVQRKSYDQRLKASSFLCHVITVLFVNNNFKCKHRILSFTVIYHRTEYITVYRVLHDITKRVRVVYP